MSQHQPAALFGESVRSFISWYRLAGLRKVVPPPERERHRLRLAGCK